MVSYFMFSSRFGCEFTSTVNKESSDFFSISFIVLCWFILGGFFLSCLAAVAVLLLVLLMVFVSDSRRFCCFLLLEKYVSNAITRKKYVNLNKNPYVWSALEWGKCLEMENKIATEICERTQCTWKNEKYARVNCQNKAKPANLYVALQFGKCRTDTIF